MSRLGRCVVSVAIVNCRSRASIPLTISELVRGVAVLSTSPRPSCLMRVSVIRDGFPHLDAIVVVSCRAILQLLVDEAAHEVYRASAVSLTYTRSRGLLDGSLVSSSEVHGATARLIDAAATLRSGVVRLVEALIWLDIIFNKFT